ncbi:MAG: hypothetical protein A4E35_01548 [Methanoregula sp. PtaU1.Bin051]|nr:MAG: hypothetical protein A4E35_01548 [Methanoregula sp. PtaU1.Bin051]
MPASVQPASRSGQADLSQAAKSILAALVAERELLARRLVADHHAVTEVALNTSILRTILGVLYLRIGEDRGFAGPGTLDLLATSDGVGRRLYRAGSDAGLDADLLFEKQIPNSGPALVVPDDLLRDLIRTVQTPEFPVTTIPLHELASVFEHLLGTTMRVTEGCRVKPEGKSVVVYTGSVHVTPWPVVDFIVRETLGGSGTEIRRDARVLDPACGTGMFLLAAYRYLVRHSAARTGPPGKDADLLQKNLCKSVFGTDIDPESVAAARFILLIAFLEEHGAMGSGLVTAGRIREIVECLQHTIRCGNALIGTDYFSGRQVHPFNVEERRKVNPFDWSAEFSEIMSTGGFDAVIGAPPPYRPFAIQTREEYYQTHFGTYAERAGLYGYFTEKGISLLRPGGRLSFLVPDTFLRQQHARPFRRLLLSHQILGITETGISRMLADGPAPILILKLVKGQPVQPFAVSRLEPGTGRSAGKVMASYRFAIDQHSLGDGGWTLKDRRAKDLLEKIRQKGTPLETYVMEGIGSGTHRIRSNPFVVDAETKDRLAGNDGRCRRFFIPLLRPSDIRRYVPEEPERFVISVKDLRVVRSCRSLQEYLESAAGQQVLQGSQKDGDFTAGEIRQEPESFPAEPKIVFSEYQHGPAFTFDRTGSYTIAASLLAIVRNDPYLAAVLNSSLGRFLITGLCPLTDRGYHISPALLKKFPVITPDFDKLPDKSRHDKIVALVTHFFSLHEYLRKAKTDQERRLVQQEIEAVDVKIDALVYELYGLTAEEIAVVEEAAH